MAKRRQTKQVSSLKSGTSEEHSAPKLSNAPKTHTAWSSTLVYGLLAALLIIGVLFWAASSPQPEPQPEAGSEEGFRSYPGFKVVEDEEGKTAAVLLAPASERDSWQECRSVCAEHPQCSGCTYTASTRMCAITAATNIMRDPRQHAVLKLIPPHLNPVHTPDLYVMWGYPPVTDPSLLTALSRTTQAMIGHVPDGLNGKLARSTSQALDEAAEALAALVPNSGKADPVLQFQSLLSRAAVNMFQNRLPEALALLKTMEDLDGRVPAAAGGIRKRMQSYVLEGMGQTQNAAAVRLESMQFDGPANRTYDRYLRLGHIGYAMGASRVQHYGPILMQLHAFRTIWTQLAMSKGMAAWTETVTKDFPDPGGASGFFLAGGANVAVLEEAANFYLNNDFVIMRQLLHPFEVTMLENYFATVLRNKLYSTHDPDLGRTPAYNDRIGYYFNAELRPLVEQAMGYMVKPSYSFLCHYVLEKDDPRRPELRAHTDRLDNTFTLSLQLFSDPRGPDDLWPIFVDTSLTVPPASSWRSRAAASSTVEARMPIGDSIVFQGRIHAHWRDPLPKKFTQFTSLLFHFVHLTTDLAEFHGRGKSDDIY